MKAKFVGTAFFIVLGAVAFLFGAGEIQKWRSAKRTFVSAVTQNNLAAPILTSERKSFAFLVYAHNAAHWCEKALRSILEQDYEHYRILFIDDGSIDGTLEKAQQFISDNRQDYRFFAMRNELAIGPVGCLYRAAAGCDDREILIPIDASNWLINETILSRLNSVFQHPEVWIAVGQSIDYPSYRASTPFPSLKEIEAEGLGRLEEKNADALAFYAGIFKSIRLFDLVAENNFSRIQSSYLIPLFELSGGRVKILEEPLVFSNQTRPRLLPSIKTHSEAYCALADFPTSMPNIHRSADLVILSRDRPMQLYACLESVFRNVSSAGAISVIYSASDIRFQSAYEAVKAAFPKVRYFGQGAFKDRFLGAIFGAPSDHILLMSDEVIISGSMDLSGCCSSLEKTQARGFYFQFGRHEKERLGSVGFELNDNLFACDALKALGGWNKAHLVGVVLYCKQDLKSFLSDEKYDGIDSLENVWRKRMPLKRGLGLYFEYAKAVGIPASTSPEELLAKFGQGLKIDLDSFLSSSANSLEPSKNLEFLPR